jgi:predicted phage tail protein
VAASVNFPPAETATLLTALQTGVTNLSAADADTESGSHESFALAATAELQFDTAFRNVAYYVQSKADAKPDQAVEIILSAALKTKKSSDKMKAPSPIDNIVAKVTGDGNTIKLLIKTGNPRSTHIEILMTATPDIEGSWQSIADITARRFLVTGLTNGVRYYFKARAINSIGKSIYSNVVSQIAA